MCQIFKIFYFTLLKHILILCIILCDINTFAAKDNERFNVTEIVTTAASSNNNINLFSNTSYTNQNIYVPILNNTTFSDYISSTNSNTSKNNLVIDHHYNNSRILDYNDQVPLLQLSLKPKAIRVDELLNHTVTIINSEFPKKSHDSGVQTNTKLHFSQYLGVNQNVSRKTENSSDGIKYNVLDLVKNLQTRLKNIRNDELGVAAVQEIFDAMDFTVQNQQEKSDRLKRISYRLSKKLEKAIHVITHLYNFFVKNITNISLDDTDDEAEDDFETQGAQQLYLNTLIQPCPFEDFSLQQNYNKHEIQVLNYLKNNDHRSFSSHSGREIEDDDDVNYIANSKITEELHTFNMEANHIKHLYFLSSSDHASDHQCQYYFNDLHFRYLYVSAIQRKHVFLLLDNGNAFNYEQMELLKLFVQNILKMLSHTDTITIVLISDEPSPMNFDNDVDIAAENNYIFETNIDGKRRISKFIENLNYTSTLTNHSRGFEYSFELLKKQNLTESKPLLFLYATRGLLHKLTDKVNVLATIAQGQSSLNVPVVINTCAIVLDERRIMYEKQFLRDIAQQNYTKYDIDVSSWYNYDFYNLTGTLYIITKRHPERIIKISTAVFENLFLGNWRTDNTEDLSYIGNELQYHLPIYDYNTKEVIISMTRSIQRFGVIGLNLYLTDLAEDIIYFKNTDSEYAFMTDINGITIFHPAFSRPNIFQSNNYDVDIGLLENSKEFKEIIQLKILSVENGNASFTKSDNVTKIYHWKRVQNAYILCLVTVTNGIFSSNSQNSKSQSKTSNYQQTEHFLPLDLLYHRLDLVPPKNPICRHFRQIATLETGTVFLSGSAFQSPFTYLKNSRENKESIRTHTAQSIMAYIKDSTSLLANPGLLSRIRNDVAVLYHVMSYLKKRHLENGEFKKYIIRRYVATTTGIVQIYPGCILGTDLEPSRRPWYRKAIKYPGKIIATEPYLDAGGAGYIVTIAHTIFEGKSNALHNAERDIPAAIVAIDVPYAFFYRLIIDASLFCSERNIKCLLIEDNGYLLGHPSFMEPSTITINHRRPKEHITHKESFVANDILNHKQLVRKQICASYQNRTSERYYIFNTSSIEIFTNVVHGDRTKYQMTSIPGTNIFAAVLNSTRDGGAFCPCSTVDRICLNCNRMDQTDCECPCECPLKFNKNGEISMNIINRSNNDSDLFNIVSYDYCESPIESLDIVNSMSYDWNTVLKACININCDLYSNQNECIGIMGCEWCQLDVDGNPFNSAFCTSQNSCFNGVLGAMTPYGDNDIGAAVVESVSQPAYSAIGPVGGAIIALCIVVGFAMYCYRQNLDSSIDQLYPESIQEDNFGLPLSRFNYDDCNGNNGLGDDDIIGGNGSHILHKNLIHPLANSIAVSEISPYHMSSGGYRRPNGESDNGYSTMTPHEDSDMCFTLVEPLINTNKRLSMSADSMSISTSISSPTNQGDSNKVNVSKRNPDYNLKYSERSSPTSSGIGNNSPALTKQMLEQTILPQQISPHHILAPVTVHRHMEASS